MKLFMIPMALLEIPISGWTCFRTLKMYMRDERESMKNMREERESMKNMRDDRVFYFIDFNG
jgi:hypothetical protein